jgi:hypothetical protein
MVDPELLDETPITDRKTLRQFACLWLVVLAALAAWQLHRGRPGWAALLAGLAIAFGPLGIVRPQAIRPLFSFLMAVTLPIGHVLTRVLLAVLFYGLFTPIALFFKLVGRDALSRRRDAAAGTYWLRRPPATDARRYYQQY